MLLLQALLLLPLIALGIKFFGFKRIYAEMAKVNIKKDKQAQNQLLAEGKCLRHAEAIARLVQAASRHGLYRPNCLQRSLLLWWLLRRRGIESDLRIGVRKQEGTFQAHAWVEYLGCVLNDRSDVDQLFAPFANAIQPLGVKTL